MIINELQHDNPNWTDTVHTICLFIQCVLYCIVMHLAVNK